MLHHIAELVGSEKIVVPMSKALKKSGATFQKNSAGQWRFHIKKSGKLVEVKTLEQQQRLFLMCDGKQGSWTPEAKEHAKNWAAAFASVFEDDVLCNAQADYLANRLIYYVVKNARDVLFDSQPSDGWVGATRAAFLSFSANIPAVAADNLKEFLAKTDAEKWSEEWCIGLLQQLTFGKKIAIYPHRYDRIRPWLESLWGVSVPKTSDELKIWAPQKKEDALSVVEKQTPLDIPVSVEIETKHPVFFDDEVTQPSKIIIRDQEVPTNPGVPFWLTWFFTFIKMLFTFFSKKPSKDDK